MAIFLLEGANSSFKVKNLNCSFSLIYALRLDKIFERSLVLWGNVYTLAFGPAATPTIPSKDPCEMGFLAVDFERVFMIWLMVSLGAMLNILDC